MTRQKHYLITYHFKGEHKRFSQRDSRMTDADAWYYSALHSGAGRVYGVTITKGCAQEVRLHAQQCGVTGVQWQVMP